MNKHTHPDLFSAVEDPFLMERGKIQKSISGKVFTVYGNPPAKSNCYRIISFKTKKKADLPLEEESVWLPKIQAASTLSEIRAIFAEIDDLDKQKAHYSLAKSGTLKAYEKSFIEQSSDKHSGFADANICVPFKFVITVYFPTNRSDLDNSLKVVLDCLQTTKTIKNDNLCNSVLAHKQIDKESPRIEFSILEE